MKNDLNIIKEIKILLLIMPNIFWGRGATGLSNENKQ